MSQIKELQNSISTYQNDIINHKLYGEIKTIDQLNTFMEHHIYAVWDFMSLLKVLQQNLTCTKVPWVPVSDTNTSYLINEIVVGEESDVDEHGNRMSHFELYLKSMEQSGANVSTIQAFLEHIKNGLSVDEALDRSNTPLAAKEFVRFTFSVINSNKPHIQSAVFTFGREDLIPDMFLKIVKDLDRNFPNKVSSLKYYLERHIEVDGGHHGELSLQMTQNLCGEDKTKWDEAETAVKDCLIARKKLWEGVLEVF